MHDSYGLLYNVFMNFLKCQFWLCGLPVKGKISNFIKNIFICVLKIDESLIWVWNDMRVIFVGANSLREQGHLTCSIKSAKDSTF